MSPIEVKITAIELIAAPRSEGPVHLQVKRKLAEAGIPVAPGSSIAVTHGRLVREDCARDNSITFTWSAPQ